MSIWATLSTIDCRDHTEKKGKFDYLSWTWAWAKVKEAYPLATFVLLEDKIYEGGYMEVRTEVTIEDMSMPCWLPVTDHNNRAIAHPDSFAINTARMRCLVKNLAFFGLGFYIYAGESFPAPSQEIQDKYEEMLGLVAQKKHWGLRKFVDENQPYMDDLFNLAPEGKKTQFKSDVRAVYKVSADSIKSTLLALDDALYDPDSGHSVTEILAECGELEKSFVLKGMEESMRKAVELKIEEES